MKSLWKCLFKEWGRGSEEKGQDWSLSFESTQNREMKPLTEQTLKLRDSTYLCLAGGRREAEQQ